MKSNYYKILSFACVILLCFQASAQSKMEESFHANGSIRVVVAVSIIVMTGLLFFVLRMDRRVKKLEQNRRSEN
ncbi:MAG: CcmD family protein [Flavobacteriales bacterium]